MKKEFRAAYVRLKEELQNAVAKDKSDVVLWRECLENIPYCDLVDASGEEILHGVQIKGYIDLWKKYPILNYYEFEDDEDEDGYCYDQNEEARKKLTGRFLFKENNKAVLIYPSSEGLPKYNGTWADVLLEIFDYGSRKLCTDPEPTKDIIERIGSAKFADN